MALVIYIFAFRTAVIKDSPRARNDVIAAANVHPEPSTFFVSVQFDFSPIQIGVVSPSIARQSHPSEPLTTTALGPSLSS
jgi:hypothetical protein